ncbi:MAG: hypothetical protein K1X28_00200 [Parachlamydiales bacterium]|nr:hypothetical protein [Parachlamydiales bacterium]
MTIIFDSLYSLLNSDLINQLRDERSLPFIQRLADIEYLTDRIAYKSNQIEGDERTLTRRLSESPPALRVPIPWQKDEQGKPKEVPMEEAIPIFEARRNALLRPIAEMIPGADEAFEKGYNEYQPLIHKAINSQFKEHKAHIQKQLEMIKKINAMKRELNNRVRDYCIFAEKYYCEIDGEWSRRLIDAVEKEYVRSNLTFQNEKLNSIMSIFHDYKDSQSHIIGLQKEFERLCRGESMTLEEAMDAYTQRIQGAIQSNQLEMVPEIDQEFAPLFIEIKKLERLNRAISDSRAELSWQCERFKKACVELDALFESHNGRPKNRRICEYFGVLYVLKQQILSNQAFTE